MSLLDLAAQDAFHMMNQAARSRLLVQVSEELMKLRRAHDIPLGRLIDLTESMNKHFRYSTLRKIFDHRIQQGIESVAHIDEAMTVADKINSLRLRQECIAKLAINVAAWDRLKARKLLDDSLLDTPQLEENWQAREDSIARLVEGYCVHIEDAADFALLLEVVATLRSSHVRLSVLVFVYRRAHSISAEIAESVLASAAELASSEDAPEDRMCELARLAAGIADINPDTATLLTSRALDTDKGNEVGSRSVKRDAALALIAIQLGSPVAAARTSWATARQIIGRISSPWTRVGALGELAQWAAPISSELARDMLTEMFSTAVAEKVRAPKQVASLMKSLSFGDTPAEQRLLDSAISNIAHLGVPFSVELAKQLAAVGRAEEALAFADIGGPWVKVRILLAVARESHPDDIAASEKLRDAWKNAQEAASSVTSRWNREPARVVTMVAVALLKSGDEELSRSATKKKLG